MNDAALTSYDEVPYESNPFPQTHPDRLATLATLFGVKAAPVQAARVLELGCASGGNLIPHAVVYPDAHFVGVDLSSRQIQEGQAEIEALGLKNVDLRTASITDIDASHGKYDYIICHGVYSWVPDEVQDHILQICSRNLSPNGVAYISYNTYPGWHMRGMIRDMMRYHVKQFSEPQMQVNQARALLNFLSENAPTGGQDPYAFMLKNELELLRRQKDSYLYHDHLEEVNDPVYFHQFIERADAHGLQYLAEAEFSSMLASNFPQKVGETLRMIAPGIIRTEQYMDFLRNRTFRQTLLVHKEVPLKRNLGPRDVWGFLVASPAKPVEPDVDAASTDVQKFQVQEGGAVLTTGRPLTKAAMELLARLWPESISFRDLLAQAADRIGLTLQDAAQKQQAAEQLGDDLLQCYTRNLVELAVTPRPVAREPGDHPLTTSLARRQAERGRIVCTLRHQNVALDEISRIVLSRLDGSRDRAALVEILASLAADGKLQVAVDGRKVEDAEQQQRVLQDALPHVLTRLADNALITRPA